MAARRALLAWELGSGFGHLAMLRAIARPLRQSGHACAFAVRNLAAAVEHIEPDLGPVLQAPARLTQGRNPVRTQVSYASLLHNVAFDDPQELAGRIRAWRDLMRALRTEIVFADHSPIALIAARSLGLPCTHVGIGWSIPPVLRPFPSFRPRLKVTPEVLAHNEQQALSELNTALEKLKIPAYASLQEIFQGCRTGLLTLPELDHYEGPRPEKHLGVPLLAHGAEPQWPAGRGPKIFAYLQPSQSLVATLEALAASRARVLVRVRDVRAAALQQFLRPGLAVTDQPVDMQAAAAGCDAFVNYGAHGTVAEFLLAGKPQLLIPVQHEQVLLARRVAALGAAVVVQGAAGAGKAVVELLEDGKLKQAAQAFATRHAGLERTRLLPDLVEQSLQALTKTR